LSSILLESLFSCKSESITAAHVRDHSTAIICSMLKCNWLRCNVGCHLFRNRQRKFNDASVYNVRKLDFQANLCEAVCRREKVTLLQRLSFGMGSLAEDCFQPLVNRISIKTLET